MKEKSVKVIVTLGPATHTETDLRKIKDKGVDFVRVNMSHSSIEDLRYFVDLSIKVGIPFIVDTEGSQVRTGNMKEEVISLKENDEVRIHVDHITGDTRNICLRPLCVIDQLEEGDLIHIDFDTVILRVADVSCLSSKNYIITKAIAGGKLGQNKAVTIDPRLSKKLTLPPLTQKDHQSIGIGLERGVKYIAVSFVRSGACIDHIRTVSKNSMKIISKIECVDALENLDEIIEKSDFLLIDRGDLSKEISIAKIPFAQKLILHKSLKKKKGVFVATNLLETMIDENKPTRAEVHDVIASISDGAYGLTLAAETAIGKHPMACINMINQLIQHSKMRVGLEKPGNIDGFIKKLEDSNYLLDHEAGSLLVPPHGGKLVSCVAEKIPDQEYLDALTKIEINSTIQMDVEQIAIGSFSPLEGFMGEKDFNSVIDTMRLSSGIIWPLPIVLDISLKEARNISVGQDVALTDEGGRIMAILRVEEKYGFNKKNTIKKIYGILSDGHPGVRMAKEMKPVLLGGKITLLQKRISQTKEYELTPRQVRKLFTERGWVNVVGFHTRNVIHKCHEFIQMKALEQEHCDGLFVHPAIGQKKLGDFHAEYIIKSYELMMKKFYPEKEVIFATFAVSSRYAGPREALFTAICRKNFGCSHFIVGRDHTGVKDFYRPNSSQDIFDEFPDLGVKIIKFSEVLYSDALQKYVHQKDKSKSSFLNVNYISGTQVREMLKKGEMPPEWFMRPEISEMILDSVNNGEEVFVAGGE